MGSQRRKWREVKSDEAFAALFANAHIVQATPSHPAEMPPKYADLYWEFSDGSWLAMVLRAVSYYESQGYEVEKEYYHLAAND